MLGPRQKSMGDHAKLLPTRPKKSTRLAQPLPPTAHHADLAILFCQKCGALSVDSSLSFSLAVTVLPFGLAFSQASSKPCSKSSMLMRPSIGSLMLAKDGCSLQAAAFSSDFLEPGISW